MAAPRRSASPCTARRFAWRVKTDCAHLREQASEIALYGRFWVPSLFAFVLALVLSAAAEAKGTGYVFVSHEKTNNLAVIDPRQDYRIIRWIPTSHRPRDMKFA